MVSVRTGKQKGNCFEYDCHTSLLQAFPDAYLTKQRGFQLQYDIQTDKGELAFECKRLRGISWNQLVKFYDKLIKVIPEKYNSFILFKSNHQPCLVFNGSSVCLFENVFQVPWIRHEPVKRIKRDKNSI